MGASESSLGISAEALQEYQDCTFFTKKEILHILKLFCKTGGTEDHPIEIGSDADLETTRVKHERIMKLPEFRDNAFGERILQVFSDGQEDMSFEDFLDMASVFSEGATRDVKSSYAFRMYDFDNDGYLGEKDLQQTVEYLIGAKKPQKKGEKVEKPHLDAEQVNQAVQQILAESDLDQDNQLSYIEFEHVVSRAPDFTNTFRIRF